MSGGDIHINNNDVSDQFKFNQIKIKRRISSAHPKQSPQKINKKQQNSIEFSKTTDIKKSLIEGGHHYSTQELEQERENKSQRIFNDDKLIQQSFTRCSLNLSSNNNMMQQKQDKRNAECNAKNQSLKSQNESSFSLKFNKGIMLSQDSDSPDKKTIGSNNSLTQNGFNIDMKVFSQKFNIQQKRSLHQISQEDLVQYQNEQDNIIQKEQEQQQNKQSFQQYNQNAIIMKIRESQFSQMSNLLDAQKHSTRLHKQCQSLEIPNNSVVMRQTQNMFQQNNNIYEDNRDEIYLSTMYDQNLNDQNQKTQKSIQVKRPEIQQQYRKIQQNRQEQTQVLNNYQLYLKNKQQDNQYQNSQKDLEILEDQQQKTIKGGIIIGKQVERQRKNTQYGKGISVFENLLLRKQKQQQQSLQIPNQKKQNYINKQDQSGFTSTFYQNLIKQSKVLSNLICQHQSEQSKKNNKNSQGCNTIVNNEQNKQQVLTQISNSSPSKYINQLSLSEIETQGNTLYSTAMESLQTNSEQYFQKERNNSESQGISQRLGESHLLNNQKSMKNGLAMRQYSGQIYQTKLNSDICQNEIEETERSFSQFQERVSDNQNRQDYNAKVKTKEDDKYTFNFKKKPSISIHKFDDIFENNKNNESLSISSTFTDKVIKHFRFASSITNQSDNKNNLILTRSIENEQNILHDTLLNSIDKEYNFQQNASVSKNKINQDISLNSRKKKFVQDISQGGSTQILSYKGKNNISRELIASSFPQDQQIQQQQKQQLTSRQKSKNQFNQYHPVQSRQFKRQSLQLYDEQTNFIVKDKNNKSAYDISIDQKTSTNLKNKKIQNYVSELGNKYSFHSNIENECCPWDRFEEDDQNEEEISNKIIL